MNAHFDIMLKKEKNGIYQCNAFVNWIYEGLKE